MLKRESVNWKADLRKLLATSFYQLRENTKMENKKKTLKKKKMESIFKETTDSR